MTHEQLQLNWAPTAPTPAEAHEEAILPSAERPAETSANDTCVESPSLPRESAQEAGDDWLNLPELPIATPLPAAVAAGVFGQNLDGPMELDAEEIAGLTAEHAHEMIVLLSDIQAVENAMRDGTDPATGRTPRTAKAAARLAESNPRELARLQQAYADAVAAYANGFGEDAASTLDDWVRKVVADNGLHRDSYPPTHPWHYYHAGDNAAPINVEDIPPDADVGRFLERDLPKDRNKRRIRLEKLLEKEANALEVDKQRYKEIATQGAEALSRYDREIAHTSDAMAVACSLALKYTHISLGLGRAAWLSAQLAADPPLLPQSASRSVKT